MRDTGTLREPSKPYEARWLLMPLLSTLAIALGLISVSPMVAFCVWAGASVATIGASVWHEAQFERARSTPALPSATSLPRRRPRLPAPK
jgi:hypothetical protein